MELNSKLSLILMYPTSNIHELILRREEEDEKRIIFLRKIRNFTKEEHKGNEQNKRIEIGYLHNNQRN